jgi:hypothetical protein
MPTENDVLNKYKDWRENPQQHLSKAACCGNRNNLKHVAQLFVGLDTFLGKEYESKTHADMQVHRSESL